jgi:phosphoglycerol transferase MdoB-like AlkP superfamily enzyme
MINLTASEYMLDPPFHVYYLTVNGHCNYNFYGNFISAKNKDLVAHLDYSEPVRAYLAAQLELEFALTELLAKLEATGQLENTVIALSADHYPYGLVDDNNSFQYINELAGEEVELTFELFRNSFILWAGDMEEPVIVDKYCSSLDIAPTIANLFGLEFDSRLYIGRDILSDAPAFVVFKDYSFINDKIKYNMKTKQVTRLVDEEITDLYLEVCVSEVKNMFKYSRLIYRKDYYGYLFDQS